MTNKSVTGLVCVAVAVCIVTVLGCADNVSDTGTAGQDTIGSTCRVWGILQKCQGYPLFDTAQGAAFCTQACGVPAYCPDFPQRDIDYCAQHPDEVSNKCSSGYPDYYMDCIQGEIALQPGGD